MTRRWALPMPSTGPCRSPIMLASTCQREFGRFSPAADSGRSRAGGFSTGPQFRTKNDFERREVYLYGTTGCAHQLPLAVVVVKTPRTGSADRGRVAGA